MSIADDPLVVAIGRSPPDIARHFLDLGGALATARVQYHKRHLAFDSCPVRPEPIGNLRVHPRCLGEERRNRI